MENNSPSSSLPSYPELSSTLYSTTSVLNGLSVSILEVLPPSCSPCSSQNYSLNTYAISCHFCAENLPKPSHLNMASSASLVFPHCLPDHSCCFPSFALLQPHRLCCSSDTPNIQVLLSQNLSMHFPLSWMPPPVSNMLCSFVFYR